MALSFINTSTYASVAYNARFNTFTNLITCCGWIRRVNGGDTNAIISRGIRNTTINEHFHLDVYLEKARFLIGNETASSGASGTTNIALNTWYHIAGTWDGTTIRIYVNGELEGETTRTGSFLTTDTTTAITIAADTNNGVVGEFFGGYLEDVRIYQECLDSNTIQTIYTCHGNDHMVEGLFGRWIMTEQREGANISRNSTFKDISINNANAIVSGPSGSNISYVAGIISERRRAYFY